MKELKEVILFPSKLKFKEYIRYKNAGWDIWDITLNNAYIDFSPTIFLFSKLRQLSY
ncbi:MAG TPA: hypothetical protein PLE45_01270 [Spirochaetota bacterium]|nr:hypothetical protein [Spirochaetota bacterium]HPP03370.1 hypothetical protein [Spirochaetota bacterium]